MSIAVPSSSSSNVAVPPQGLMRRWTVDEYHTMIQAGVFAHDEKFELLEGWIVPKMSRNPPHDVALDKTHEQLRTRLARNWRVRIQSAITTSDSEPEPDIAVVPGPVDRYLSSHPVPSDIALIVEIAESSLLEDGRDKARIYARAGIMLYWIINLERKVEVFSDPTGAVGTPEYRRREEFSAEQSVPFSIGGQIVASIPVRDVLP